MMQAQVPSSRSAPVVGVIADLKQIGAHGFHAAGHKYIAAVVGGAHAFAVVLPVLAPQQDIAQTLDLVDGLLLTGSYSNVEPHHYAGPASAPGTLHDPDRDANSLPLINAAIAAGVPLLGICRGFQEMNVALGGSLHQRVHEVAGMLLHKERDEDPLDTQYGPAHPVSVVAGGQLAGWLDGASQITVNSLHSQGVQTLALRARAEAIAPDGLVEAFSVPEASRFAFAVQWHPEWRYADNPVSLALFAAFGEACAARRAARLSQPVTA
ncbi:gamma-glutamyl-gamma-aminobutyrate hydrolase family protein [Amantichitinum ursilacus]|uniref:gamma-glutamyl-gamma-aminobutyrate hydrolase n=1 Tax=Amantichitinum ursilacus TaxID=857265 RepID=A0A0N1JS72_9NEIS|nr:gamma-glutamyl-gamma-aminobutyrate hydrolase family protein [Amantichitinum ursilacus]KPC51965.1 Gamma-glutamyl-gamma-aminobutyrate hydrolase PuuD [Amantichitinum ursilacus]